ncbi:MAG: DUF1146 family protein [Erysipelotrichaceae bacterium]
MSNIVRVTVTIVCFVFCFIGVSSLDFTKFMRKEKLVNSVLVLFLVSMALAYLVSQFLFSLLLK